MARFNINIPDAFGEAAKKAQEAAKAAAETVGAVGSDIGSKVGEAVKTVAETDAGKAAIGAITDTASAAIEGASKVAVDVKDGVVSTVNAGAKIIAENSPEAIIRRHRIEGFKDGINQGAYLAGEVKFNFYYA